MLVITNKQIKKPFQIMCPLMHAYLMHILYTGYQEDSRVRPIIYIRPGSLAFFWNQKNRYEPTQMNSSDFIALTTAAPVLMGISGTIFWYVSVSQNAEKKEVMKCQLKPVTCYEM